MQNTISGGREGERRGGGGVTIEKGQVILCRSLILRVGAPAPGPRMSAGLLLCVRRTHKSKPAHEGGR